MISISLFDPISKQLIKNNNCMKFIKSCNPNEFNLEDNQSSVTCLTVGWLESIANKLGTFWALPERKYIIQCLMSYDETGQHHIRYLHNYYYYLFNCYFLQLLVGYQDYFCH